MASNPPVGVVSTTPNPDDLHQAALRVLPRLDAVRDCDVSPSNVKLAEAAGRAMSAIPALNAFRPRIAALPEFDIDNVDSLADFAKATWYFERVELPPPDLSRAHVQEMEQLRAHLLRWATPLAGSNLLSQAAVDIIASHRGAKRRSGDVVALASLFRDVWPQVCGQCAVTEQQLERAFELGPSVFEAVSCAPVARAKEARAARMRTLKAWTLLDRAYAQCRRAMEYLRFAEGDASQLLPPLRPGRRAVGRPSKKTEQPPKDTTATQAVGGEG